MKDGRGMQGVRRSEQRCVHSGHGESILGSQRSLVCVGAKRRGFRQRRTPGRGNASVASPFGREADSLRVLSVNVLTSGWVKLLNHTRLTGMRWHFLFYLISGDLKAPSFVGGKWQIRLLFQKFVDGFIVVVFTVSANETHFRFKM